MQKFLNWFFAIYWVVMGIMCFTGTITLTPFPQALLVWLLLSLFGIIYFNLRR